PGGDAYGVWKGDWGEGGQGGESSSTVTPGVRADGREILVTTVIDARIDHRQRHPPASLWPLAAALAVGVTFIGAVFTPWALVWGTFLSLLALAGWTWPRRSDDVRETIALDDGTVREVGVTGATGATGATA